MKKQSMDLGGGKAKRILACVILGIGSAYGPARAEATHFADIDVKHVAPNLIVQQLPQPNTERFVQPRRDDPTTLPPDDDLLVPPPSTDFIPADIEFLVRCVGFCTLSDPHSD